jgi:hypothetical protein
MREKVSDKPERGIEGGIELVDGIWLDAIR